MLKALSTKLTDFKVNKHIRRNPFLTESALKGPVIDLKWKSPILRHSFTVGTFTSGLHVYNPCHYFALTFVHMKLGKRDTLFIRILS